MLRNGDTYFSDELYRNYNKLKFTHPYVVGFRSYTPKGIFAMHDIGTFDIVNFTPYTDMKENELTIEIPNGKIVDWDESKKQNKVVLKDKQLTYEDVCKKLFKNKKIFYTGSGGDINIVQPLDVMVDWICNKNNATTEHQLECILAKNQLANVAKYLNDGWKPNDGDFVFCLTCRGDLENNLGIVMYYFENYGNQIIFKTQESARQAIEILGEETVKLALESLGI